MDEATKQLVKEKWNLSEDEIGKMSSQQKKFVSMARKASDHRVVAEVIASEHCSNGLKPGDKYYLEVFGKLLTEETKCNFCLGALGRMLPALLQIMDRFYSGIDPEEDLAFPYFDCADTGLAYGGVGKVRFRVYVEKKP